MQDVIVIDELLGLQKFNRHFWVSQTLCFRAYANTIFQNNVDFEILLITLATIIGIMNAKREKQVESKDKKNQARRNDFYRQKKKKS